MTRRSWVHGQSTPAGQRHIARRPMRADSTLNSPLSSFVTLIPPQLAVFSVGIPAFAYRSRTSARGKPKRLFAAAEINVREGLTASINTFEEDVELP